MFGIAVSAASAACMVAEGVPGGEAYDVIATNQTTLMPCSK
jgi:hypothetical protein